MRGKKWEDAKAGSTGIEQVVYLSNLIGADLSLVQPGGGNTSVKLEEEDLFGCRVLSLVVKGSGTDLRTIDAGGFTHLYTDRLAVLKQKDAISDEQMMHLMRVCMILPDADPLPSVETPLHSLLPQRFVAHTHDVATLSLTDTPSAAEHVRRVYSDDVAFLEYARPGVPLAKRLAERFPDGPPPGAKALVMEKHGLAVWGETARECYETLGVVIRKAEEYVAERARGKRVFGREATIRGQASPRQDGERRDVAAAILPAIRGELMRGGWRCVLHLDDSPEMVAAISDEGFAEVAARGVMTPEHILRAGMRPLVVPLRMADAVAVGAKHSEISSTADSHPASQTTSDSKDEPGASPLQRSVRDSIREFGKTYTAYADRHGVQPIPDYPKTIVIPGAGIVFAGKDRRDAMIAADCYRATMQVMASAEAVERFEFLSETDACEMEYWPLERRKIEESEKTRGDLEGKVALVIGAASGIGRAAALRFAEEGAHIAACDLDHEGAAAVAAAINGRTAERAVGLVLDVSHSKSMETAVREAVLHFGGIDVMFYSAGVAPQLQSVTEMTDDEVEQQLAVHYRGAVAATREVSKAMLTQGTGGRLVYNTSKAAFAPGEGAAAYGASKAALVHYVRNVANELGRHGITANYINADAVDTPLFRSLLAQRAKAAGLSEKEMLARYAERSALREALVPAEAVADAALWLASDRSAHTTGCVITVGGGAEGMPR